MMDDNSDYANSDLIAVVGYTCRFPGARNSDSYWKNLEAGIESIRRYDDEELKEAGVSPALLTHPQYVKAGSVIEDIDLFDAGFFGYNPREAEYADPQQRLILECAWEAFEHAGYNIEDYREPVGVFVSSAMSTYLVHMLEHESADAPLDRFAAMLGNEKDSLSTLISYKLNLKGPSYTVQSHCSSSLVAVHVACQSLFNGECSMALAGGVTIRVPHKTGYFYQPGSINSPDGKCRPFDANARGTVFGNGVGLVVMKRLEDALNDRDCIYALVRGSAVNNDGKLKAGYTAPSVEGQSSVVSEALAVASLSPEDIDYIEAHGTGTALGDPTEMTALKKVFSGSDRSQPCIVGSSKSNIGHLDTASGIAGFIKVIEMLRHRSIPPTLNFEEPNPEFDLKNSPFRINTHSESWQVTDQKKRIAGVSSFGVGGTNAHIILMEAEEISQRSISTTHSQLIPLSARTEEGVIRTREKLGHALNSPSPRFEDTALTLQAGRKAFAHRCFCVAENTDDLRTLCTGNGDGFFTGRSDGSEPSVAFMFSGQGAQHIHMGRDLYQSEPVFRKSIDTCADLLKSEDIDLLALLFPKEGNEQADESLRRTKHAQPALFSVSYALAQLWMHWGIKPSALIGHSVGEFVAATLAGVFSLEDAIKLIACRGRLMEAQPRGSMMAVESRPEAIEKLAAENNVVIAAYNGPQSTVVAGTDEAVEAFAQRLGDIGIEGKRVNTSHAFHSPLMDEAVKPFQDFLSKLSLSTPSIPIYSNVTGTILTDAEACDPQYWARHLRAPVKFSQGVADILESGCNILLEVGPGQILSSLVRRQEGFTLQHRSLASMPHPKSKKGDRNQALESLGHMWMMGAPVDWHAHQDHMDVRRVALPTYPFERMRFWYEGSKTNEKASRSLGKRENLREWLYTPTWRRWRGFEAKTPVSTEQNPEWLVFVDHHGLADAFIDEIEKRGEAVTSVYQGSEFERISDGEYVINPSAPDDYTRLFDSILDSGPFNRIAHFWNIDSEGTEYPSDSTDALHRPYYNLFFLSQSLLKRGWDQNLRMAVFANRMLNVLDGELVDPAKSALMGITRVLPKECRSITCHTVDIGNHFQPDDRLIGHMLTVFDLHDTEQHYPVIAIRNGNVWVEELESLSTFQAESATDCDFGSKEECALIVGGLGGIGSEISRYVASLGTVNLAIMTRSGLPPRSTWNRPEALPEDKRSQIESILEMESNGIRVEVYAGDVADEENLRKAVSEIEGSLGPIRSLIHAAGTAGGGMITLRNPEETERVLRAKTIGLNSLMKVLRFEELRQVVLCSSLSVFLGEYAQSDYCAANSVMDAWANYLSSKEIPVVSINWDTWSEQGMSVTVGNPNNIIEKLRVQNAQRYGMTNQEGIEILRRSLSSGLPRIAVSTRCPSEWEDESKKIEARLKAGTLEIDTPKVSHDRPSCSTSYVAPESELERKLADMWQTLLGIREIGVIDDFIELGGHSLLATQMLSRISQEFPNVELSLGDLFATPTIRGVVTQIETQLSAGESPTLSLYESLISMDSVARAERIKDLLKTKLASLYDLDPETIREDLSLNGILSESSSAGLIWELKRELNLRFYPPEFERLSDFGQLVAHVSREFDRKLDSEWVKSGTFDSDFSQCIPSYATKISTNGQKNPPMVFLHSSPRSGSTLLRVLLAGHEKLISPPELGLLSAETMGEWKSNALSAFSMEGLVAAFAHLRDCHTDEARVIVDNLIKQDLAIKDIYRMLQEESGSSILIDKTPLYGISLDVLRRAEQYFENPKYIHLIRHPFSVIDSLARNRMERIFTQKNVDPYRFAEDLWRQCESNFVSFFDEIDPKRVLRISYEDLVTRVEPTMRAIAEFLDIDFSPVLTNPYDGKRMVGGLGDPDFLNHSRVEPELAESWRHVRLPWGLKESTRKIAEHYGYQVPDITPDPVDEKAIDSMTEEELDRYINQLAGK